jgi:hypothetical protein
MSNNLIGLGQFVEIAKDAVRNPRGSRSVGLHPSAGLYEQEIDSVIGIRVKMLVEDDGGTWESDNIPKPAFIWDFKKIHSSGNLIDSGYFQTHFNLKPNNVGEVDEGLYFFGSQNSNLTSPNVINLSQFNNKKVLFNIWFKPKENQKEIGNLFSLSNWNNRDIIIRDPDTRDSLRITGPLLSVALHKNNDKGHFLKINFLNVEKLINNYNIENDFISNIVILADATFVKVFINNEIVYNSTMDLKTPLMNLFNRNFRVSFGEDYLGDINYAFLGSDNNYEDEIIPKKLFKFRYPLPRNKEYVDLTNQLDMIIDDILIDAGTITKSIENIQGNLFLKTNEVKIKNV